jgi:hypothetical protein
MPQTNTPLTDDEAGKLADVFRNTGSLGRANGAELVGAIRQAESLGWKITPPASA